MLTRRTVQTVSRPIFGALVVPEVVVRVNKIIIIIIIIIIIKESETIQHITAACEQLAPTEYVKRHDGLAKVIQQKLAEGAEMIDDKSPYYKYTPANVLENENFKLYWNRSVLTDKTVSYNRPDITFMNKKTKNSFFDRHSCPKYT